MTLYVVPIGNSIYNGSFGQNIFAGSTITESLVYTDLTLCSSANGLVVELIPSATNCQCDTTYIRVDLIVDFDKDGKTQQLLHELKYNSNIHLGIFLGELIGTEFKSQLQNVDFIIPVF